MGRRPLVLLLAAAIVALASLSPAATGARLRWQETAKDGKVAVLRFGVTSLTFGRTSWSAHVSFRNVSKRTIRVGDRFGVAIYAGKHTFDLHRAVGFAYATRFSPARPTRLKPGASWSGVIGGYGQLEPSRAVRYARVVFGPLSGIAGQSRGVFWITNHALPLAATAKKAVI